MAKMYRVCSWNNNQHKMFNYNDKMYIARAENPCDETEKAYEESERLLEVFNGHVDASGIVMATYPDLIKIREIVACYDMTHN